MNGSPNTNARSNGTAGSVDDHAAKTAVAAAAAATRLAHVAIVVMFGLLLLTSLTGCSRLRLPAIDPSGSCLFSPLPTTTGLALPGTAGEGCRCFGCLSGLGDCLRNCRLFNPPAPAFATPVDPPACLTPSASVLGGAPVSPEPSVPGPGCSGTCANGPPAVLLGEEAKMADFSKLPDRGERGCILLSPQKIVAPVGGEVILLSGVCGTDGYLQTGAPLEWMMTPESVGTFLQVGDDDPGLLHRLVGIKKSEKQDQGFARGVTSTKQSLITRGNLDPRDDVKLEKGQTWLSVSSPSEGISRVTVLAPESDCWDQRKATATIYWVDAAFKFPDPQRVAAGTPVSLMTRVTRSEGAVPARGWKVRYEVQNPELARFAGDAAPSVVEVEVDDNGNAIADLFPVQGTAGTTVVDVQVIRPGGLTDNMPEMLLGRGQAFVTWSSPQLRVEAFGPDVASSGVPYLIKAIVSNPGDQPVTDVQIELPFQPGVVGETTDAFASYVGSTIVWNVPRLEPQTELEIFAQVTAEAPNTLEFTARGEPGLAARDSIRTDIYRPQLSLSLIPREPVGGTRYVSGDEITYDVIVRNNGDRPLETVQLTATGDAAMRHLERGTQRVTLDLPAVESPLQPGAEWVSDLTFVSSEAGRRCVTVEATAELGQSATQEACVTVINPPVAVPDLTVTLESNDNFRVGEERFFNGQVTNSGRVPLENVRAVMVFDPQLDLVRATTGADQSRLGQYLIEWMIPRLDPGQSSKLQGEFRCVQPASRCSVVFTAEGTPVASRDGVVGDNARGEANRVVQILPNDSVAPPAPESASDLPPIQDSPRIPSGPSSPNNGVVEPLRGNTLPPPPVGDVRRSDELRMTLFQREISPRANSPIPYSLEVTNDSDIADRNIVVEVVLPEGVQLDSISQTMDPNANRFTTFGNRRVLETIRNLLPGETVRYELILSSDTPQTYLLGVEAISDRRPRGIRVEQRTQVLP